MHIQPGSHRHTLCMSKQSDWSARSTFDQAVARTHTLYMRKLFAFFPSRTLNFFLSAELCFGGALRLGRGAHLTGVLAGVPPGRCDADGRDKYSGPG